MTARAWRGVAALVVAALVAISSFEARADKRVALVIGNASYQNVPPLSNPAKDANAIAQLFRSAGFDVVQARNDLGNLELKRAVREFTEASRQADVAVMYFAGHGIEIGGMNYLLPVDAKLARDYDADDEAVPLDRVVRALEPARRLRLIILVASFTQFEQNWLIRRGARNSDGGHHVCEEHFGKEVYCAVEWRGTRTARNADPEGKGPSATAAEGAHIVEGRCVGSWGRVE